MKRFILFIALVAAVACVANGQRRYDLRDEETIQRTLDFSPGAQMKVLEVDSVQGSIRVIGYEGRTVELTARKRIRAESNSRLDAARQEVRLDISDKSETINIFVNQPGHDRSTSTSSRSNWSNRGYEVSFDFDLRVPRDTALRLWTINDGDIRVENIDGDFLLNHVNGGIELRNVSGSGRAKTINGPVKAAFRSNPARDSSFSSLNGEIEVMLQPNLSADLKFKSFNGGVYTDFPASVLPAANATGRSAGGFGKSNNFSSARVGNGGPELTFDGFNGDVRILLAK